MNHFSKELESQNQLMPEKISSYLTQAANQYYKLIIISSPNFSSNTPKINFEQIAQSINKRYININLELSRLLLEITPKQRPLKTEELLKKIVGNTHNEIIFLEHLEILFDTSLKLDPLLCLQKLSRNPIIVALWSGKIENDCLIYAEPNHPEYRRYPTKDVLLVKLEQLEAKLS